VTTSNASTAREPFRSARAVTSAHQRLARSYSSPLLSGPPRSELLLELVAHLYTEEEAALAQHLPPLRPRSAADVARAAGCDVGSAAQLLDHLAFRKMILLAWGEERKYAIMPIVPGTFELALMRPDQSEHTDWHRGFSALFEQLWDTGFMREYARSSRPPVRYLPVGRALENAQGAWPSDRLEEVLADYDDFAVGLCQCRLAMDHVDRGCGKTLENCTSFGRLAPVMVERGLMRPADRSEVLAIKRAAEEEGCVTFIGNVAGGAVNGSCSCCGCCCHALRTVSELNCPGLISRPHFVPRLLEKACKDCGQCAKTCPVLAWSESEDGKPSWEGRRCIGCGLCVARCPFQALELQAAPKAPAPDGSLRQMLLKMAPGYLANTVSISVGRLLRKG